MSYRRPGVTVTTQSAQTIASQVGAGDRLLVIGTCDIFPATFTEVIKLIGSTSTRLSKENVDDAEVAVVDSGGTTLVEDTDYTVTVVNAADGSVWVDLAKKTTSITDEVIQFATAGSSDALLHGNVSDIVITNVAGDITYIDGVDYYVDTVTGTVWHISGGTIPTTTNVEVDYKYATIADAEPLTVTYEYTPSDLYEIKEWTTLDQIRLFYGASMSGDSVNSPISLAAQFIGNALVGANAPIVKTLAVDPAGSGTQNTTYEVDDWAAAFAQIGPGDATVVLLLTDSEPVYAQLKSFLNAQEASTPSQRIVGFCGGGINTHTYERCSGGSSIFGLASKRIIYVSTDIVLWNNPTTGNDVLLPGYYAAAELAGIAAALPLQVPLTHKRLSSFKPIPSKYELTMAQKNTMAASGVCVVETNKNDGLLWCVHGKTTALTGPEDEELSIVRTLDALATELQATMEEKFIGSGYLVDDMTAIALESATISFFTQKVQRQWITDFQNVAVTVAPEEPRAFVISANIKPAYPVDYIDFTLKVGTWQSA